MIGQTLGHYEIAGSLGNGGMGEVWRARDTKLGRASQEGTLRRRLYACILGVAAALAAVPVSASRILYLAREERMCDGERIACVDGSLTYHVNTRVLWLHGRLTSSPGPGILAIRVKGTTRLGYVRYAPLEIALDGHATEIVDFRMIPDDPDVENWQIDSIEYVLDPE